MDVKDWLVKQREAFLGDVKKQDLEKWVVVTGNEAGGASSCALC